MAPNPPHGLRLLGGIFLGLALVLSGRLVQLQVLDHEYYRRCATRQWECKVGLPAPRGTVFDRTGIPLAVSDMTYRLSTDPHWVRGLSGAKREALMTQLTAPLKRTRRRIEQSLNSDKHYVVLGENVRLTHAQKDALQASGVVTLEPISARLYPQGRIGAALLGFLEAEGAGASGLELSLQEILAGRPGEALVQTDDMGRERSSARNRTLREPIPGSDVYLTIDFKVQAIAERELDVAAKNAEARAGSAVVLDPRTGDILALASWPAPAERGGIYRPAEWKLLPVQGVYEPGSTLKAVTSIALLEHAGVTLDSQVDAEDGSAVVEGFSIRDDRPHPGWRSFREAFILSSNICFAKFSQRLSREALFSTLRDLNFGNHYGLSYPGEQPGRLLSPSAWSERSKLTLIFGQAFSSWLRQVANTTPSSRWLPVISFTRRKLGI